MLASVGLCGGAWKWVTVHDEWVELRSETPKRKGANDPKCCKDVEVWSGHTCNVTVPNKTARSGGRMVRVGMAVWRYGGMTKVGRIGSGDRLKTFPVDSNHTESNWIAAYNKNEHDYVDRTGLQLQPQPHTSNSIQLRIKKCYIGLES